MNPVATSQIRADKDGRRRGLWPAAAVRSPFPSLCISFCYYRLLVRWSVSFLLEIVAVFALIC
jgi:hypothetical protein